VPSWVQLLVRWKVGSEWRCQPKRNPSLNLQLGCKMGPKGLGEEPDGKSTMGHIPSTLGLKGMTLNSDST